jgi:uncharacterized protein
VASKQVEVIYVTWTKYFAGTSSLLVTSKPRMSATPILHNADKHRFETNLDGSGIAFLEYRLHESQILFTHTEVPSASEGHGIASRLAKVALDYARDNQLEIVPLCEFVIAYIQNHPEYLPLVSPKHRSKAESHSQLR